MEKVRFDYSKLRGRIREKVGTQKKFAELMGISNTSVTIKLKNKSYFDQAEIFRAVDILGIEEGSVSDYFFTEELKFS